MALETRLARIPEAGWQARDRERQREQAVLRIDLKITEAIKRGRFDKVGISTSFDKVRSVFEADRSLVESLEPDINTVYMLLQAQSAEVFVGERVPGATMIRQIAAMELLRGVGGAPDKALARKKLIEGLIAEKKPVTVMLGRLSRSDPFSDRVERAPVLVAQNRGDIIQSIKDSSRYTTTVGVGTGISELLRSLAKKESRIISLKSGFEPWFDFATDYLSRVTESQDRAAYLNNFERRVLTEMRKVAMERMLGKLLESLLMNPQLVVIRPGAGGIADTRVQLLNLSGQGVETNHALVDPNYFTDPANAVYRGSEFVGLVDSAAFVNVLERVQRIVADPGRGPDLYARLISGLLGAGLLLAGRVNKTDSLTARSLEVIIASAEQTPFYERVIGLLHSSKLISTHERRQLMLKSGAQEQ